MNTLEKNILELLSSDARLGAEAIASMLGEQPSAVKALIRSLEERGAIVKYAEHRAARAGHHRAESAAVEKCAADRADLRAAARQRLLKHVEHPPRNAAKIPGVQRSAQPLRIRVRRDAALIDAPEELRRGDGKRRLAYHDPSARKLRQRREYFPAPLGEHHAAGDTVRHIRADR